MDPVRSMTCPIVMGVTAASSLHAAHARSTAVATLASFIIFPPRRSPARTGATVVRAAHAVKKSSREPGCVDDGFVHWDRSGQQQKTGAHRKDSKAERQQPRTSDARVPMVVPRVEFHDFLPIRRKVIQE